MPDIRNTPFHVIVDTAEQQPWQFKSIYVEETIRRKGESETQSFPLVVHQTLRHLRTGDYSMEGYEDQFTIERKSITDALSTFTHGRERFERELERMRHFRFAAIYIEGSQKAMQRHIEHEGRKVEFASVLGSLRAWRQRFGVHFEFFLNRFESERECIREMRQFWSDENDTKIKWKVAG